MENKEKHNFKEEWLVTWLRGKSLPESSVYDLVSLAVIACQRMESMYTQAEQARKDGDSDLASRCVDDYEAVHNILNQIKREAKHRDAKEA